ncbi:hypothetical protein [Roseomonas alba]|uniref:hypothetical protein n=1 Tax=Roseomonas alba TaxID=2846776 RepID=UPI002105BEB7|nr:hypothetical protein [Neoroseomonas alba]
MTEEEFWAEIAPRNLSDDTRTARIAEWYARRAVLSFGEEMAAMLAELLAGLRETGSIDDAAAAAVMLRWMDAFAEWRKGDGKPNRDVVMATYLPAELAWCLPGLAPATETRPTRHGRKKRPRGAPPA